MFKNLTLGLCALVLAAMRAALLRLGSCGNLADLPPDELRKLARQAFPVLYIRAGELVPSIDSG